ncbi:MAG: hypothetical protein JRN20_14880 [Nitrososphaerota archaeon]|nr:hypothetical protein [Nitrososphaerota archaeon]
MIRDQAEIQGNQDVRSDYSSVKTSLAIGLVLLIANNLFYASSRVEFYTLDAPPFFAFASLGLLLFGVAAVGFSLFSFLRAAQENGLEVDSSRRMNWTLQRIISDALFKERKAVLIGSILYAVLFSLSDGILIFQPGVNFLSTYGVKDTSYIVSTCCGPTGYVPSLLLFFPTQNLGLQLIPVSILIMVFVSILVGLNLALLRMAVKLSKSRIGIPKHEGLLGGTLGAALGLFAGCPTCAAAFFLSMIAGSGATAVSLFLAGYQPLFVLIALPLLLATVFWQAKSIRRLLSGCAV